MSVSHWESSTGPFRDRWAVITGASSPVGLAVAAHLIGIHGMRGVLHCRTHRRPVVQLIERLRREGLDVSVQVTQADLADPQTLDRWIARVRRQVDRVGVLFFNAADFYKTPWAQMKWRDFLHMMVLHGWAPIRIVQKLYEKMEPPARIIFMADAGIEQGYPAYAAYTASKAVMVHWTRLLARVLSPWITVHAIAPYWIRREDESSGPVLSRIARGEPASLAALLRAVDLILEGGGAMTGQVLWMDSGRWLG
jgi:NAD(P)-dependent dehydrogenase (short-subunit alcohol dehydrogenase family)